MDPPSTSTPKRHKSTWKSMIHHVRPTSKDNTETPPAQQQDLPTHPSSRTPQRRARTVIRRGISPNSPSLSPQQTSHTPSSPSSTMMTSALFPPKSSTSSSFSSTALPTQDEKSQHQRTHSTKMDSFRVEQIFLAEFDIDKGSVVRCRYPLSTTGGGKSETTEATPFPFHYKEQDIAAQMLPDGSHNTAEDATYFFLKKNIQKWRETQTKKRQEAMDKYGISVDHSTVGDEIDMVYLSDDDGEGDLDLIRRKKEDIWQHMHKGPDFLYCLNVYKMKQVKGVRRNARVKALTITSTESTIFALKPLLSRALDRIFEVDKSAQMQEAHIEREHHIKKRTQSLDADIGLVDTDGEDTAVESLTPDLVVKQVYEYINSINLSKYPQLSEYEKLFWRFTLMDPAPTNIRLETTLFNEQQQKQEEQSPVRINMSLALTENEVQDSRVSLVQLVDGLKEKIMILFNAVLYEKRIVFLGYNIPAGDVCCTVLSACLLVPALSKLMRTRVYPYCSLSDLDFLEENGFIAGACNPMFKSKSEWWDCFVDLNTNEVKVGSSGQVLPFATTFVDDFETFDTSALAQLPDNSVKDDICFITEEDSLFIQRILQLISFHKKKHTSTSVLEDLVRSHFRDYSQSIIDQAVEFETSSATSDSIVLSIPSVSEPLASSPSTSALSNSELDDTDGFEIVDTLPPPSSSPSRQTPRKLTGKKSRIFSRQPAHSGNGNTNSSSSSGSNNGSSSSSNNGGSNSSSGTANSATTSGANIGNGNVIKAKCLRKTRYFKQYLSAISEYKKHLPIPQEANVYNEILRLRTTGTYHGTSQMDKLTETELISIFQKFNKHVRTHQQFIEFLSYLPQTLGGLYPVAIAIMHPSIAVRLLVVAFIRQISKIREGSLVMEKLNTFLLLSYERNSGLLPDTAM